MYLPNSLSSRHRCMPEPAHYAASWAHMHMCKQLQPGCVNRPRRLHSSIAVAAQPQQESHSSSGCCLGSRLCTGHTARCLGAVAAAVCCLLLGLLLQLLLQVGHTSRQGSGLGCMLCCHVLPDTLQLDRHQLVHCLIKGLGLLQQQQTNNKVRGLWSTTTACGGQRGLAPNLLWTQCSAEAQPLLCMVKSNGCSIPTRCSCSALAASSSACSCARRAAAADACAACSAASAAACAALRAACSAARCACQSASGRAWLRAGGGTGVSTCRCRAMAKELSGSKEHACSYHSSDPQSFEHKA